MGDVLEIMTGQETGPESILTTPPFRALLGSLDDAIAAYPATVENGLEVSGRYWDVGQRHPFDSVEWDREPVILADNNGAAVFTEPNAEFPCFWEQIPRQIVAQKYFYGSHEQGFRETSLKQMITRVSAMAALWAVERRTFATAADALRFYHTLVHIQLMQMFAFNSPVYFNVGTDIYGAVLSPENFYYDETDRHCYTNNGRPQISACFIQRVLDTMASIMHLATAECMLFKAGSGTGTDLTPIRSNKEKLSGGGRPSGPVSFMRMYDAGAAVVRSGGKTRRAAKMQTLKFWHPDILEFIESKTKEEIKAQLLIKGGMNPAFDGEAYGSVSFQNCNMSVRVTDQFMRWAESEEGGYYWTKAITTGQNMDWVAARDVMNGICDGTWFCGDPGLQFEDTIQHWHTCPNSGPINSSNPCSEYMFLDDSACNLASKNMLKFRKKLPHLGDCWEDFDTEAFFDCVDIAIIAQETFVGAASYPTERIAENSHKYRPLGLGYANVGGYVIALGIPYDSEIARQLFGEWSSVLTGRAFLQSAKLARRFGPFEGFAANREPMLRVMNQHREAARELNRKRGLHPGLLPSLSAAVVSVWDQAIEMGEKYGYRNSQATCIAPTGTIAYMMDCDTTGIEPEIALVRFKTLFGQGLLKLVNRLVPEALDSLGYTTDEASQILNHIERFSTIEDVYVQDSLGTQSTSLYRSGLRREHINVFDCSLNPRNGKLPDGRFFEVEGRSIEVYGHVYAMSAAAPFISGAISKTVNMPKHATVDDIKRAYFEAWRRGVKALALYRDGSKESQPVSTTLDTGAPLVAVEMAAAPVPMRRRLPRVRTGTTVKFEIEQQEGYFTANTYPDGTLGELFIKMSKEGSTVGGLMGVVGVLFSIALQHGVPLKTLVDKMAYQSFPPSGPTMDELVPWSKSIIDYIFRWIGHTFIPGYADNKDSETPAEKLATVVLRGQDQEGRPCPRCGAILSRVKNICYQCMNCGYDEGGCGG